MGIPDDLAALTTRVAALEAKVAALSKAPPANGVTDAIAALPDRQKKELWRQLRDGI